MPERIVASCKAAADVHCVLIVLGVGLMEEGDCVNWNVPFSLVPWKFCHPLSHTMNFQILILYFKM